MAWVDTIREDEWDGDLAALYASVADPASGRVDNIIQIHSLDPAAMAGHQAVYEAAMGSTKTLRKVERELIALVVSDINGCHY
jgi:alkylhydroperoxidase family enzyme